MIRFTISKKERAFWLSMPLLALAFLYILYGERIWKESMLWILAFPLLLIACFFYGYLHVLINRVLRKRFPSLRQTAKRIIFKFLLHGFILAPATLIVFLVFDNLPILQYHITNNDLRYGYLAAFSFYLAAGTLGELNYIIEKYKESVAEKDLLEQMQLAQEFDGLKQKVNPHFLFNCFNTLSSLISEDKDKAEQFLDELSHVYRYLLRNNTDTMTTLGNEMKFIQSYFRLLKTRHGDAVSLQAEVDKQYETYLLPSLSLQILVENVVKHNALSKNKPLHIEIFTTAGNKLVVNNNLQRRSIKAPGNNVGLENIKAKYRLLKQTGFQVMEDAKNFTVVLPLIWKPLPVKGNNEMIAAENNY